MTAALVLTCEHAGNRVPADYRACFASQRARRALASHRGYDPGALEAARGLAHRLDAPLLVSTTTRLLVEVNRSLHHRRLFSEFTMALDEAARARVIAHYYTPHRHRVEAALRDAIATHGRVVHVGVHSFTPRLGGVTRRADVGLLHDPSRVFERTLCRSWRDRLREASDLHVRLNYPYRGSADGFTTWLRRRQPARAYAGIELEINQRRLVNVSRPARVQLLDAVAESLERALAQA